MNNKGFMMAEVVVVSSVILVTLVSLYVSYNKILALYNQRIDYYDVTTLYELDNIRRNVGNYNYCNNCYDNNYKCSPGETGCVGVQALINDTYLKVYHMETTLLDTFDSVDSNLSGSSKFNDYFRYLYNSVEFETKDVYVMERCINNDVDNCKYAYLKGGIERDYT